MFLGIEIGGTKLQLGVGRGDGKFVAFEAAPDNGATRRCFVVAANGTNLREIGVGAMPASGSIREPSESTGRGTVARDRARRLQALDQRA